MAEYLENQHLILCLSVIATNAMNRHTTMFVKKFCKFGNVGKLIKTTIIKPM